MFEMRAIRAMGQLVMAGSASRWALALFWTAERSPGVSESLAKGALGVFASKENTTQLSEFLVSFSVRTCALSIIIAHSPCYAKEGQIGEPHKSRNGSLIHKAHHNSIIDRASRLVFGCKCTPKNSHYK